MKYLWEITLDDFLKVCEMAQANGKKAGDNMEQEFLEYAKLKGIKHSGATELNKQELIDELKFKGKNVLDVNIDKKGNMDFNIEQGEKE